MVSFIIVALEPQNVLRLDVSVSTDVFEGRVQAGFSSMDPSEPINDSVNLLDHPTDALLTWFRRWFGLPQSAKIPVCPGKEHVVGFAIGIGEEKLDKMRMALVLPTEPLQYSNFLVVVLSFMRMKLL